MDVKQRTLKDLNNFYSIVIKFLYFLDFNVSDGNFMLQSSVLMLKVHKKKYRQCLITHINKHTSWPSSKDSAT